MLASGETPRGTFDSQSPSVVGGSPGRSQTYIKVRDNKTRYVYSLAFDGALDALTEAQLRAHLEGVSGVAADDQVLLFEGSPLALGFGRRLYNGAVIQLDRAAAPLSAAALEPEPTPSVARALPTVTPALPAATPAPVAQPIATPQPMYYSEARPTRADEADGITIDVAEEPLEKVWHTTELTPDEALLEQNDYQWKMEQVRFETERMARDREMRRRQQELEYEAALLDRQRLDLERQTQLERMKFDAMQEQEQEDLEIQARWTPTLAAYSGVA